MNNQSDRVIETYHFVNIQHFKRPKSIIVLSYDYSTGCVGEKFEVHCTTFFKIYNIQILHVIHRQHNEYVF